MYVLLIMSPNVVSQLVEQLGADNVVDELGGTLTYNHTTWISNRTVRI